MRLPDPDTSRLSPNLVLRHATSNDVQGMADLYFRAFSPSHRFMREAFPHTPVWHQWFVDAFQMGIDDDPKHRKTFAVIDKNVDDALRKVVGFARWYLPQPNGNLEESWPDYPKEANMEILEPFFSGMDKNREALMGKRPHWHLELLATDPDYQRQGIAASLVQWGCDCADEEDLEAYVDSSEAGAKLYTTKRFGFVERALIPLPEKPETYGTYRYATLIRPSKSVREQLS